MSTLTRPDMRLVRRGTEFKRAHRLEMEAGDLDCTAMDDAEFARTVAQAEQQALAADRALNNVKATPAYFAPSDLFSLSLQNRGAL